MEVNKTKSILKYIDYKVLSKEFLNERALAINISGCPIHCPDCNTKELWDNIGRELTEEEIGWLEYLNTGVTCTILMGGDNNPSDIVRIAKIIRENYPKMRVAWFSGRDKIASPVDDNLKYFTYIKLGPFIKERGPLTSKDTNQRVLAKGYILKKMDASPNEWYDITDRFWRDESKNKEISE